MSWTQHLAGHALVRGRGCPPDGSEAIFEQGILCVGGYPDAVGEAKCDAEGLKNASFCGDGTKRMRSFTSTPTAWPEAFSVSVRAIASLVERGDKAITGRGPERRKDPRASCPHRVSVSQSRMRVILA